MQNELLRLRSVENELTSKSKELESCKKECDQLAITLSEKNDIIHDLLIKSKESVIPASSQTNTPDKVVNNDLKSMHQTDLNETPKRVVLLGDSLLKQVIPESIAEKCFDIWGILKMASVKSVESGNNCFSVNHIIRCRSKFLPLGFSKFVLVLILW